MFKKLSRYFPGLIAGLFLSGMGLAAYSDEFEQKDITYPEDESYSIQATTDDTNTPTVEQNPSAEGDKEGDKIEKYTVKVPVSEQGSRNKLELPVAGMSKDDVEARWGQPDSFRNAVGNPPISSWMYNDFSVYFEHGHVIRSVMKPSEIN